MLEFEKKERLHVPEWDRARHAEFETHLFEDIALFLQVPEIAKIEGEIDFERTAVLEQANREELFRWFIERKEDVSLRRLRYLNTAFRKAKCEIFCLFKEEMILKQADLDLRPSILRPRLLLAAMFSSEETAGIYTAGLRKIGIPAERERAAFLLLDELLRFRRYKDAADRGTAYYEFPSDDIRFFFDRHSLWPWSDMLERDIAFACMRRIRRLRELATETQCDGAEGGHPPEGKIQSLVEETYKHKYGVRRLSLRHALKTLGACFHG